MRSASLVTLVAAFAQFVPRYSTAGSEPDFIVEHWYYGFPFTFHEYHQNSWEGLGTGNPLAFVADMACILCVSIGTAWIVRQFE